MPANGRWDLILRLKGQVTLNPIIIQRSAVHECQSIRPATMIVF